MGAKSRRECFSADPLNLTGLHNSSSAGLSAENGIGLAVVRAQSKKNKSFRRDYQLKIAHKSHHKTNKVTQGPVAGLNHSTVTITHGTGKSARAIQGLTFANSAKKQLLLKRLGRLHAASRDLATKAK